MPVTAFQRFAHVGEKIRALRLEQRLTQGALAQQSSTNISTISLIESGKRTGTVEAHGKLARALGITLSELYAGLEGEQREVVSFQPAPPKAESYAHPRLGFAMQPLTTNVLEKRMMPVLMQLEVGGSTVQEQARAGSHAEKFVYVQDGAIEIRVGDQTFPLRRHQTLYFDATVAHQLRNIGKEPAKLFIVTSPPML